MAIDGMAAERDLSEPPHSDEAEQAVLGSILKDPTCIDTIGWLKPAAFRNLQNQHVFRAMLAVAAAGKPPEYTLIGDQLRQSGTYDAAGGMEYLADISIATPTAAFVEHYARIVERTWNKRQLISASQRIAEMAYRDNLDTAEALTNAEEWIGELRNGSNGSVTSFRGLTLDELGQRPGPSWVVDGLLPADAVAVLEGTESAFKTFLALDWALCIALGVPWLGRPVQQGRVLYLLGEGSRGLVRRARAWQLARLGKSKPIENLHVVVDQMPQLWQGDARHVLASNPGPFAYIVGDTLARAMVGGNENQQQDMNMLIGGCDDLRRGTGACMLLLHHLNVQGQTRGSTVLPGAIDTKLRLVREGQGRTAVLSVRKQKDAEFESPIVLVARTVDLGTKDERGRAETSLVLDGACAAPVVQLSPSATTALATLCRMAKAKYADWRDAAQLTNTSFRRARTELLGSGYVDHVADWYTPTARGQEQGPRATQGPLVQAGPGPSGGPKSGATHGA